jgi:hypothetical protein
MIILNQMGDEKRVEICPEIFETKGEDVTLAIFWKLHDLERENRR